MLTSNVSVRTQLEPRTDRKRGLRGTRFYRWGLLAKSPTGQTVSAADGGREVAREITLAGHGDVGQVQPAGQTA